MPLQCTYRCAICTAMLQMGYIIVATTSCGCGGEWNGCFILYITLMLDNEFQFYVNNQAELVKKYNGRFLVIHNREVFGDYATLREAYTEGTKNYPPRTFMVHKCGPGKENYTFSIGPQIIF